ncbi:hypothetical protein B0H10DRAFT_1178368 [Mycena sp. CBHHK59/15]|nr:hypothetical protein B0H10DRAFT_1178368 [Mycena sp. CBHHK59/15]
MRIPSSPVLLFILSSPPRPVSLSGLHGGRLPSSPLASPYSRRARDPKTIAQSVPHTTSSAISTTSPPGPPRAPTAGLPLASQPPHSLLPGRASTRSKPRPTPIRHLAPERQQDHLLRPPRPPDGRAFCQSRRLLIRSPLRGQASPTTVI